MSDSDGKRQDLLLAAIPFLKPLIQPGNTLFLARFHVVLRDARNLSGVMHNLTALIAAGRMASFIIVTNDDTPGAAVSVPFKF